MRVQDGTNLFLKFLAETEAILLTDVELRKWSHRISSVRSERESSYPLGGRDHNFLFTFASN